MHKQKSVRYALSIAAGVALALVASSASAGFIEIQDDDGASTEGIGSVSGTLTYSAGPFGDMGTLVVSLTNESDAANGGYITGFVFNINSSDPSATASLLSASHDFLGLTNEKAPPFGMDFTAGAALGGNWTGGGSPHGGIAVNTTGTFEFEVTASDAGSLTAESFMTGQYEHNFVVRMRGFDDGGSDKVPMVAVPLIPAPPALALLLLAGVIGSRRRR